LEEGVPIAFLIFIAWNKCWEECFNGTFLHATDALKTTPRRALFLMLFGEIREGESVVI